MEWLQIRDRVEIINRPNIRKWTQDIIVWFEKNNFW